MVGPAKIDTRKKQATLQRAASKSGTFAAAGNSSCAVALQSSSSSFMSSELPLQISNGMEPW
eukprot:CAMPEP_0172927486 /NCGR_PEP_ID=MMETSP1075-20121228/217488_1 /TAXON_ID=2916 /ORGANISM="Ceratium fusus, Strain PA161109" /LENGTH=61 /DNA_ID=CAMNT_0013788743 /DNA_START=76 /DNA_END=258 /DNA_ORIENTATION=-